MATKPELEFAALLDRLRIPYSLETRFAGHRIDFTLVAVSGQPVLWDVNGDWWHSKPKIIECDRTKIVRVVAAGGLPRAVFSSRLGSTPETVAIEVRRSLHFPAELPWWDWKVPMPSLPASTRTALITALQAGSRRHAS
jgi:hypothetical protein